MIFGIVGYGRFGKLLTEALLPFGDIVVYDKSLMSLTPHTQLKVGTLRDVAQADLVFLVVPISEFETTCLEIKNFLKPQTLVVDCCSVKVYPAQIMHQVFSKTQPLIATHPLFGPDSVKKSGGLKEHKIVICPIQCDADRENQLKDIFNRMGLHVLVTTPEEHDKQMANSQGLVHFIGRGLAALNIQSQALSTPDFDALLNINNMVINDTWQLFLDMQRYNPYTKPIREKLIQELIKVHREVEQ